MVIYLLKRIAGAVAMLIAMSAIIFCLQNLIPADPARTLAGPAAPAETLERIRQQLGLDEPVAVQYGRFVFRLLHGDLGTSVRTRQPVASDLQQYLPATVELALVSLVCGAALGCFMALLRLLYPRFGIIRLAIIGAGSTPIFLTSLLLVYFFWFRLAWFPGSGRLSFQNVSGPSGFNLIGGIVSGRPEVSLDALWHIVLPALALSLPIAVAVSRSLGSALHNVMNQPYIGTARGKGLGELNVLLRHGLRNAATAPLAMIGLQVSLLFGNLIIVEQVFAWPGLGFYMVQALASADLPAVLGVAMVFGVLYTMIAILMEVSQSLADPRIGL
jgi:ABC-type dipeptide/oligopeptide/nickel transport system permease component